MKKIPTIFERDWNGDRSRVVPKINPKAEWVFLGHGVPMQKLDGTSCLVQDNKLFKRRELRNGEAVPAGFVQADFDEETGKTVGWVPVGEGKEDQWHREGRHVFGISVLNDGTYELIGPKIQGNPEGFAFHQLVWHGAPHLFLEDAVNLRTFEELKSYLETKDIEGIVWHSPDGRMAKIKARDFGLKRRAAPKEGSAS